MNMFLYGACSDVCVLVHDHVYEHTRVHVLVHFRGRVHMYFKPYLFIPL